VVKKPIKNHPPKVLVSLHFWGVIFVVNNHLFFIHLLIILSEENPASSTKVKPLIKQVRGFFDSWDMCLIGLLESLWYQAGAKRWVTARSAANAGRFPGDLKRSTNQLGNHFYRRIYTKSFRIRSIMNRPTSIRFIFRRRIRQHP